ncbi:MAG: helix-turn-helix transcriptional regulator [Pseudomonadota bacterium]
MELTFGQALKDWRAKRRMSQFTLGLEANVSARHISFLESGRSQPSRSMVALLCETLDLPPAARNGFLTAAGFAPRYRARAMDEMGMAPVKAAVDWMLDRHAPYPAFALDRHWRVVRLNAPAAQLFSVAGLAEGDSLLEALADGLGGLLENRSEVIQHTVARLRTESAHFGGDATLDAAIARLSEDSSGERQETAAPVVPARYRLGDQLLSLFSTIAQFGTAEDIALAELRIELLFPADAKTAAVLQALAEPSTQPLPAPKSRPEAGR